MKVVAQDSGSVAEIAERCDAYQSEHVLMFSLVINPQPDLIRMVLPEKREQFVKQLTERTMNDFFDARGIDTGVEWSAVLHHRQTDAIFRVPTMECLGTLNQV